jgi:hypothetical protein
MDELGAETSDLSLHNKRFRQIGGKFYGIVKLTVDVIDRLSTCRVEKRRF